MRPRVRFAPSPTGYLHVGGARTALFNWLFARRHGGVFVLRIEDTDLERSSSDMTAGILDSLRWLGLDWDEGPGVGGPHAPYLQSERLDMYRAAARTFVADGLAYYCYCTTETLNAKREAAEAAGGGWRYDRTCLNLPSEEVARREAAGMTHAVRFLVPPGETSFTDLVRGEITVAHDHIEDFVILRSDGQPTYQLSVVVDDVEMGITHVVRGDDHISNTPKQILLYRALGAPVPAFAHVPLILGPDRKRLSKRHGATSVGEYEKAGCLPEAMVNFLALLGWSPGAGDQEVFTRDELVTRFSLEGISGGNAVFNPEKLAWFNQQHIARLSPSVLVSRLQSTLDDAGLWREEFRGARRAWFERVLALVQPRAHTLDDFVPQLRPFVTDRIERDPDAVAKYISSAEIAGALVELRRRAAAADPFDAATLEPILRGLAAERGLKAGALIHAARAAVVGQAISPGIFDVLELVGRERVVSRLDEVAPDRT
jgi:glutamyl-tRNA synthetase